MSNTCRQSPNRGQFLTKDNLLLGPSYFQVGLLQRANMLTQLFFVIRQTLQHPVQRLGEFSQLIDLARTHIG